MILAAHNAHLTTITGEAVVPDPVLEITGGPGAAKWTGDAQALIRDQTVEEVRGNMRILVRELNVELPLNLPYEPRNNDLLTFITNDGEHLTLEVRTVDRQFWGLGRARYICRYQ
jgi:hypothetical protein